MANHSYWRIFNKTKPNGSSSFYSQIANIQMYAANSNVNLCVGGSAFAGSQLNSSYPPSNAFDGGGTGAWYSAITSVSNPTNIWIAYQFPSPVSIDKILITGAVFAYNIPLVDFDLMWSDDGITWTTYASFTWPVPAGAPTWFHPQTFSASTQNTTITWNSPSAGTQPNLVGLNTYALVSSVSVANAVGTTNYVYFNGYPPKLSDNTYPALDTDTGVISNYLITDVLNNANATYTFTVRAINNGKYADRTFTGNVVLRSSATNITSVAWNSPSAGNYPSPYGGALFGSAFNLTPSVSVSNAVGQTIYYAKTTIPDGTTLNQTTGTISGTLTGTVTLPPSSRIYNIRSVNNFVASERQFETWLLSANSAVTWNSPAAGSLGNATVGSNYSFTPSATNSTMYGIVSGALPAGTTLQSQVGGTGIFANFSYTGVISGTLSNAIGPYTFTMRAYNGAGTYANGTYTDRTFTGNIVGVTSVAWVSPTAGTQPDIVGATSYTFTSNVSVTNPVGSTIYSIFSGSIPAGTSLDASTGIISGTLVNTPSSYSFTLRATNNSKYADRTFSGNVIANPTIITWVSPSAGTQPNVVGKTFYDFIANTSITNPVGPTVYSIVPYSPFPNPTGTTFDPSTGTLFGRLAPYPYDYTFTMRATNNGIYADRSFNGSVLTPTTISWYNVDTYSRSGYATGSFYATTAQTTTTNAPLPAESQYIVSAGSLISGITLNASTGICSGTITASAGTVFSFTIRAMNNGAIADKTFSGNIVAAGSTIIQWNTPAEGALPVYGTNQSQYYFLPNITVSNPSGLTTASIVSGSIPTGTTFNASTGEISGKNPVAGNYSFTMRVTNNGKILDRAFTSVVVAVAVTSVTWVSPSAQGTFNGNSNYNFVPSTTLTSTAGPTVYSIVSGAIPSGTTFDPKTGIISGTLPNITTSYGYTMRATVDAIYSDRTFSGNVVAV